ncbi:cytoplasmic protein [Alteribacter lacisalsi]|uniref:Cytoplasmic protein n=1 Tax=Alteribacter lacisalsi TaxID=2045244 RepID=A0A2W0H8Z1_9BACI|nr:DUF523 and DUF1722 domain-containing protein [Alteribacter lacisalsi]PYZ98333.1 cytoplasmic protein [Alteribacter lacisalsi]
MRKFQRPKIVVSKCLEFEPCRYDGAKIKSSAVSKLKESAELIPVCPEVEIGLPTPRDAIRLVDHEGEDRLVLPAENKDLTESMNEFSTAFLSRMSGVDGFILKGRSPSCGIFDTKVYTGSEKSPVKRKSSGLFAKKVKEFFPEAVIEDDGRLRNFSIREHFLTGVYTMADFRHAREEGTSASLVRFHTDHKFLFMSFSPSLTKEAGNIVANPKGATPEERFNAYAGVLSQILKYRQRETGNISVCEHLLGYFKNSLTAPEKEHFLTLLSYYRDHKVPLSSVLSIVRSWVFRFEQNYLFNQSFFEPYPADLLEITDSGKGRNY